jgi:hypothetical protein
MDSEFYVDKNNDGYVHVPVLFGDDQTHTDSFYTFRFNNLLKYWLEKKGEDWY